LKKEIFETVKRESVYVGILFLISLVIFKIAFYKENFMSLLRNVFSLFWLFVVPGYFIMLYWEEKLGFVERIVIGISVTAAITGISSYYLSLAGLNISLHTIVLPVLILLIGIIINLKK
jgi:hypothetical protein